MYIFLENAFLPDMVVMLQWDLYILSATCIWVFLQVSSRKFDYRFIFVELEGFPPRTIVIEDNRWQPDENLIFSHFCNTASFEPRVLKMYKKE